MGNLDWTLLSSQCNLIESVPHINKALTDLNIPKHIYELDGELYTHGMNFNDLVSRTKRTVDMHSDSSSVEYHIFDVVSNEPFMHRLEKLRFIPMRRGPIRRIPTLAVTGMKEVMLCFEKFVENKYEGIIVRHPMGIYVPKRSTYIMKFKPRKSDFYQIIGWKEEISIKGEPKHRLGAIICTSDDGNQFSVGTGLSEQQRIELWPLRFELTNYMVEVKYQNTTPGKGVPRFPVFVQLVEAPSEEEINLTLGEL
jgi:ATP-dependent DNA ligase